MSHRTVLALACVVAVAALSLSGCGGSSGGDGGPKTYTTAEYGCDTSFAIQLTAAENRWLESSAALEGIASSFRL